MDNPAFIQQLTIPKILGDETLRRREFPVTCRGVFLAHAGVCALPQRVAEEMSKYLTLAQIGDQEDVFRQQRLFEIRQSAAKLINAEPGEIALVGPTSVGLSIVAAGIQLHPGENVLIYFDDYPSNVYPWLNLEKNGVEIRRINISTLGKVTYDDIFKLIDKNTKLVALSSCHFLSGWRLDIDEIGAELRKRGILFCVDGIQTLGAFPTSVKYVDFLAADAHKWLLGPCGVGILYIRKELQQTVRPFLLGWHNVRCPGFVAQNEIVFPQDARKYEAGTHPLLLLVGLKAALDLILEVGIEDIASELLRKRGLLIENLKRLDCEILNAEAPRGNQSAIISFSKSGCDIASLHKSLMESNIITSLRQDRSGKKYIRVSPHFYNTDEELMKFVTALNSFLRKQS